MPAETLTEVILKSANELEAEDKKPEDKVEPKPEDKKEDKKETPEEDLTEEELTLAKNLLKGLKDPSTAPSVIDYFAKLGGYTKAEVKEIVKEGTPEEKKELKDEIEELLSEQFGQEFAKKLAAPIRKAIEQGVESRLKPIHETFEQQELQKHQATASTVLDGIADKFYEDKEFPKEVMGEMDRLMDIYKPQEGQTLEEYLNDIHALAAAKKGGSLKPLEKVQQKDQKDRIERNRNDPTSRLQGNRRPSSEEKDLPPAKNLDEAIARAAKTLQEA